MSTCTLRLTPGDQAIDVMVEAVIFDCDGLLVDSESVWLEVVAQWTTEQGWSDLQAKDYLGLTVDDAVRQMVATMQSAMADSAVTELIASLTHRYSHQLASLVRAMPGAEALVKAVGARVPIGIASNGRRDDVGKLLAQSGMLAQIDAVCTADDVDHGKPAPDLYLLAASRLGVDPARAIAFDDSPAGLQGAVAAGMIAVGVNADPTIDLRGQHRLESLLQVSVDDPEATGATKR